MERRDIRLLRWLSAALLLAGCSQSSPGASERCSDDEECMDETSSSADKDDDDDGKKKDAGKRDAKADDDDDDDDDGEVLIDASVPSSAVPGGGGSGLGGFGGFFRDGGPGGGALREGGLTIPGAGGAGANNPPAAMPVKGEKTCLLGTSQDYKNNGPYQVKQKMIDLGGALGPYTIFYPTALSNDCKHPVVAWGNGTGVTGPGVYAHFFRHAATWGIITIAAHNSNAASQPFLASALDYMLKENTTSGSEFFGKLSDRMGTAGHSQGGMAATTATSHPNVFAEVCVQGSGRPSAKTAFVCETGVDDFVRSGCTSAYNAAAGPAFLADHQMADHTGTPTTLGAGTPAGKEYIRIYSSWFRCFLADDVAACALYKGGTMAPLCSQSDWATCNGKNIQ